MLTMTIEAKGPEHVTRPISAYQEPQSQKNSAPVTLSINTEGTLFFEQKIVTLSDLSKDIAPKDSPKIQIKADAQLPAHKLLKVIKHLQHISFNQIALETHTAP